MVGLELIGPLFLTVVLIALGTQVLFALGVGAGLILLTTDILPMVFYGDSMYTSLDSFALLAIPLFILTGDVIVVSGLSKKLLDFADTLVGGFRSGVGSATVLGCGLFASISGSNASDAAAIGRITYDNLQRFGYSGPYACALVASGASTGILIPPSISYILAGVVLGISSSTLFLAAFIPGIAILLGVAVTNIVINRRRGFERGGEFSSPLEILKAFWETKAALMIPFIILGGIYSGVFTPTEAAAVAVLAAIVVSLPSNRLKLSQFPGMFERSAIVNGIISPIIAVAIVLSQIFTAVRLPQQLVSILIGNTQNFYLVVAIMLLILLLAGAVMETAPNILVLGPLLLPVGREIGMDPVHFTVFLVSALGVGFITPPIGLNLYVMAGISDEPILSIAKEAVPFGIVMAIIVLLIGIIPPISMWLVP